MASAFLAKALRSLMSAKRAEVMGGALKETEAPLASVTDRRPTQWVVLRCRVESAMLSAAN